MRHREIPPGTLPFFLAYQAENREFFHIPQLKMYIVSDLSPSSYTLSFIWYGVKIQGEKEAAIEFAAEDIPWVGRKTKFLLLLIPTEGGYLPLLRVEIPLGDAMFHWDRIAYAILQERLHDLLGGGYTISQI
ncbi:glutathione S-transferase [Thermoproteus tenax]|nr:glutathione S-transferase [Thermoproteus tenax]